MELIARNISTIQKQNPTAKVIQHSQLDWYFAHEDSFLKELQVLDENMAPASGSFYDLITSFDVIIGSDLIYFTESIDPLCKMVTKF